jgi:hypothetical protein
VPDIPAALRAGAKRSAWLQNYASNYEFPLEIVHKYCNLTVY